MNLWWCKYCQRHRRLTESKGDTIYLEIKGGSLNIKLDVWGYNGRIRERKIPINYCPMCGRKLGEKQ